MVEMVGPKLLAMMAFRISHALGIVYEQLVNIVLCLTNCKHSINHCVNIYINVNASFPSP